jgi:hypothetical protein
VNDDEAVQFMRRLLRVPDDDTDEARAARIAWYRELLGTDSDDEASMMRSARSSQAGTNERRRLVDERLRPAG